MNFIMSLNLNAFHSLRNLAAIFFTAMDYVKQLKDICLKLRIFGKHLIISRQYFCSISENFVRYQ